MNKQDKSKLSSAWHKYFCTLLGRENDMKTHDKDCQFQLDQGGSPCDCGYHKQMQNLRHKHCPFERCRKYHGGITCHPDGVQCEYYIPPPKPEAVEDQFTIPGFKSVKDVIELSYTALGFMRVQKDWIDRLGAKNKRLREALDGLMFRLKCSLSQSEYTQLSKWLDAALKGE